MNSDGAPGLDTQATRDAIEYNKKFAALQADGEYNTVTTLFTEGKTAAIFGGPWLVPGINEAGINLGVKSIADFTLPNGRSLTPYMGVQGVGVLKYAAESKGAAISKVLEAMTDVQVGIDLAINSGCAPANTKAYDDADVASNELIAAAQKTAENAVPM